MGTFPFGWVREFEDDNWQLLWNSETSILYAKGINTKTVVNIGHSLNWQEAKNLALRVQNEPQVYLNIVED
ncbi:MAG TPA: hypothetical protein VH878_00130, partial [Thermodesulfobacteriota bacterium]|jgi:hypothetical protein